MRGGQRPEELSSPRSARQSIRRAVSISAFSAEELEARSASSLSDIAASSPNFSFVSVDLGNQLRIRGVGQSDASLFFDAGVAIFLDGVYLPRSRGLDLDMVGIERIEILRGPQGTLFGKNTIGGALNIVTQRPGDEFAGSAKVTTGRFSRLDGSLSLEGPIVPGTLAARVAGAVRTRDGYGERRDFTTGEKTAETGNEDSASWRAALSWTPREDLDALLSLDGVSVDEKGGVHHVAAAFFATCPPTGPVALVNCFTDPDYGPWYVTDDPYVSYSSGSNYYTLDGWGAALNVHWDRGSWALRSITGFRHQRIGSGLDPDGSPIIMFQQDFFEESDHFSQEFQLSGLAFGERLNWVAGVYYASEDAMMQSGALVLQPLWTQTLPPPRPPHIDNSTTFRMWQDSKSAAAFGREPTS